MNHRVKLFGALSLAIACLAGGSVAEAQSEDPDTLLHEGVQFRREGHDDQALERFRRAYELGHRINALGQMGFAEQALGQWTLADRDVREALSHTNDPWVHHNNAALEQAIATIGQHVGRLDIAGGVPGAEIRIDGQVVGTLPLSSPIRAVAGSAGLEVRAVGYLTVSRQIVVNAGSLVRENVTLVPVSIPTQVETTSAAPATPPLPTTPPPVAPLVPPTALAAAPMSSRLTPTSTRHGALIGIGTAAVVIGAGTAVALLLFGNDLVNTYNRDCTQSVAAAGCDADRGRNQTALDNYTIGIAAGFGVAAIGATIAIVGLALPTQTDHRAASRSRVNATLIGSIGGAGVRLTW